MNDILHPFIDQNIAICYMDDILIFTPTLDEHCQIVIVCEIFKTLQCHQLFLKPEECKFEWESVGYLGLIISKDWVTMDPVKVCSVTEWPQPNNVKGVQSFLGFINFYRWFIHHFSEIAWPLHALTRKSKAWSWGETKQCAFNSLKHAVTAAPSLAFPLDSGKFCLECDASDFTTGAVLSQLQEDGCFHPISFLSKGFSDIECNYQIYDKEMLAIMRALED